MKKFRKKAIVINSVQLMDSYASILECTEFIDGSRINFNNKNAEERFLDYVNIVQKEGGITIKTLEGNMKADFGDYIIEGINGEHYPCKPDIFEKTYELVL